MTGRKESTVAEQASCRHEAGRVGGRYGKLAAALLTGPTLPWRELERLLPAIRFLERASWLVGMRLQRLDLVLDGAWIASASVRACSGTNRFRPSDARIRRRDRCALRCGHPTRQRGARGGVQAQWLEQEARPRCWSALVRPGEQPRLVRGGSTLPWAVRRALDSTARSHEASQAGLRRLDHAFRDVFDAPSRRGVDSSALVRRHRADLHRSLLTHASGDGLCSSVPCIEIRAVWVRTVDGRRRVFLAALVFRQASDLSCCSLLRP